MGASMRCLTGALVGLLFAAGCTTTHRSSTPIASPSESARAHTFTLIAAGNGVPPSPIPAGYGARLDGGSLLTVRTGGSGSCPWVPDAVTTVSDTRLVIHAHLRKPKGDVCTSDLVVQYFVVKLAKALDPRGQVKLTMRFGPPDQRTRELRVYRGGRAPATASGRTACIALAESGGAPAGSPVGPRLVPKAIRLGKTADNATIRADFRHLAAARGFPGHSQAAADAQERAARDCRSAGYWAIYH